MKIFANPLIQLGDIVRIEYEEQDVQIVESTPRRFVVYNIEYARSVEGPEMILYLSEV
jgi:hypothetical protein